MADKKKSEINLFPYFVDGEQPTANKFNSIGIQISRNLYIIEKALGDIWSESEPYSNLVPSAKLSLGNSKESNKDQRSNETRTLSLNIPSIGRFLGPISKLNPLLLNEGLYSAGTYSNIGEVVEEINVTNVNSFILKYAANGGDLEIVDSSGNTFSAVARADLGDPSNNDYPHMYAIASNEEILIPPGTTGDLTVTYTHNPELTNGGPTYLGASANMIPDESQLEDGVDLSVTLVNGFYEVILPKITHRNSSLHNSDGTLLTEEDAMKGAQLKLPVVLREMFGGDAFKDPSIPANSQYQPTTGALIPEGFIYLKNITRGEIYTDAEYYYESDTKIKIGSLELDNPSGDKFCLLTVGTDITSSIQDINYKLNKHTHDGSNGEARISYGDIIGNVKYQGDSGAFVESSKDGNYLPQYLHRDGYDSGENYLNDENVMRGDLVIGLSGKDSGTYIGGTGASHGLYLGTSPLESDVCKVYRNSGDHLTVEATEKQVYVKGYDGFNIISENGSSNYIKAERSFGEIKIEAPNDGKIRLTESSSRSARSDCQVLSWSDKIHFYLGMYTGEVNPNDAGKLEESDFADWVDDNNTKKHHPNWYMPRTKKMIARINCLRGNFRSNSGNVSNGEDNWWLSAAYDTPKLFSNEKIIGASFVWRPWHASGRVILGAPEDYENWRTQGVTIAHDGDYSNDVEIYGGLTWNEDDETFRIQLYAPGNDWPYGIEEVNNSNGDMMGAIDVIVTFDILIG